VHNEMLRLYKARQFDVAIKFCEDLTRCFGGELEEYYKMMIERCNTLKDTVDEDWNGVFVATSK
jgi:hypothetical protein